MATRSIVPRSDREGGVGHSTRYWKYGYFSRLYGATTTITALTATDIDTTSLNVTGTATMATAVITDLQAAADWDIGSYQIRAETFRSDVASGTAPFTVASTTKVTNLNADLLDGHSSVYFAASTQAVLRDGSQALTANWDAGSFKITAEQLESDKATGAPIIVASTGQVANLNADLLDDQEGTYYTDADNILINQLGSPTRTSVQDIIDVYGFSAGFWTGATISDGGTGTVDVAAGKGFIRTGTSATSSLVSFNFAGTSGLAVSANTPNYVYVDYNAGTPTYATTDTVTSLNFNTQFVVGRAYYNGSTMHVWNVGSDYSNFFHNTCLRLFEAEGPTRASGMILSETGTRNIAITAGVLYCAQHRSTTAAKDTSSGDTFRTWYRDGSGGWTNETAQTAVSNAYYDDGTGSLHALNSNKFGVMWVYQCFDGDLEVLYGTSEDATASNAEDESVPTTLPGFLTSFCILVGRIIVQEGNDSFIDVSSAFDTTYGAGIVADHGNLAGLGDDDHSQYLLVNATRAMSSSALITNLNADKLDGYEAADIDYSLVSGNDGSTDVSAAELETLSDGSNADSLHVHTMASGISDESDYLKADGSVALTSSWDMGAQDVSIGGDLTVTGSQVLCSGAILKITGTATTAGYFNASTSEPASTSDRVNFVGDFYASRVFNAVYNDIVDFRPTDDPDMPGKVYYTTNNGRLKICNRRCQQGVVGVRSDTFGFAVGYNKNGHIPIAVAGWTLAYVDQVYAPGTPLSSKENGDLTMMDQREKSQYPERIVAIYERPETEDTWMRVPVMGRHWVKVK